MAGRAFSGVDCASRDVAAEGERTSGHSHGQRRSRLRFAILAAPVVTALACSLPAAARAADDEPAVFARFGGVELRGRSPHYADFGAGVFGLSQNVSAAGRIEVRAGEKWWFLGPAVGLVANT
ncbi:MAG: hypothetical protein EA405_14605, partial [Rhodospirillales bacterium]